MDKMNKYEKYYYVWTTYWLTTIISYSFPQQVVMELTGPFYWKGVAIFVGLFVVGSFVLAFLEVWNNQVKK